MPSSSEKSQTKRTRSDQKGLNFCSTPVLGKNTTLSSISISAVDTSSSSSAKRQPKDQIVAKRKQTKGKIQKKKLKHKKKLKQTIAKRHEIEERKDKKKKESIVQTNSDTDWETFDRISRQSSIEKATSGSESDILFKDLRSPERIREAPQLIENHLESPIFRPRRWKDESAEKITFEKNEKILPLKNLPLSYIRFTDSDDEQDSIRLRRENTIKTYLGFKKEKQNKNDVRIDKCKQWLVNVSIPTISSDLLWDSFVKNNHENIIKYRTLAYNKQKSPLNKHSEHFETHNHEQIAAKTGKGDTLKFHRNMDVVRKYWNKPLQRWDQVYDEYNYPGPEDIEFERKRGKMSLNQYLQKCREEKKNLSKSVSSPSSPTRHRSVGKEFRYLSSPYKEKKEKKRSLENYMFGSKKSKTIIANVSQSELQRINKIRQFASRLNKMEKTMIANDISLPSTSKYKPDYTKSPIKRAHEEKRNDRKNCLKQKLSKDSKPTIKSVEILTKNQFKRDKQNWRII